MVCNMPHVADAGCHQQVDERARGWPGRGREKKIGRAAREAVARSTAVCMDFIQNKKSFLPDDDDSGFEGMSPAGGSFFTLFCSTLQL